MPEDAGRETPGRVRFKGRTPGPRPTLALVTAARELPFLRTGGATGSIIGARDWSATSAGAVGSWPAALRTATGIMLESRGPALVWWGPDLVVLYNDAAMALLGEEQPARLGLPGAEAFPDLWPTLGPLLRRVLDDGVSAHLPGERLGEVFWAGSCAPVRGEDGTVLGVFTTAEDTTARVVAERRLATLRRLGEVAAARIGRADAAAVAAVDALTHNPDDLPFAALYTHDGRIAASYGLAPGAQALDADGDLGRAARRVVHSGEPELVAAQEPAMVLSVADRGALVLGLPLHRPVDEEYRAFLRLVADELTTALCGDRPRGSADGGRFEESERYRTLVAQAPVGIWVTDPAALRPSSMTRWRSCGGAPQSELAGTAWVDQVHAGDRAATVAAWSAAVRGGAAWEQGYRVVARDGSVRHVRSSARPLRGPDGEVTGFLGTTVDVTDERRAEETRRDVAAEHAARKVSDAAAARLRAMVQGLAAIVWEAEWDSGVRSLRFTFVSDRAEELLGHPARRWRDDPGFWPAIIHPDDREQTLAYTNDRTAAGLDHDITYRAVAIDGRVVWLHQVVHVVSRPDGQAVVAQGLTVDVTEQKRAERHAELLAETGRLVGDEGTAEERLAALADLVMHDLGDAAVVSLIGPDGLARRVTVAHDDETVRAALLALAPTRLPPELVSAFAPGLPVLVPVTEELNRAAARDEPDAAARARLGASNTLVVPLVIGGRVVGLLGFVNFDGARYYQPSELDLAAELGRRASLMLAADRQRARERHLHQVSADLASAAGVAEAARLLVARLGDVFDAGAMSVHLVEPERGIRLVHAVGYSQAALEEFAVVRFDDRVPIAEVVRTGEPEWIGNREDWRQRWPGVLDHGIAAGRHAAAALPLTAAGRVVGALGISFTTDREFPPDERDFVLALVAQAALAFERAAAADERRLIAETLQTSLLPPTLPGLDRLALASRYLAGARGTQAGGDWYDVLPLDGGRVAIAVGDVVGQGAKAAAIMGQLRSVLSGYLLEGHDPVQAVERLDRFACRVPGAAGSTVACLVLDPETGELTWARAGHPPPLVTGPTGTRLLEGATGTVLAVRGRPPFTSGSARIEPGESIVLYTDGLVERRGELVDDGIERLAAAAARHQALAPPALTDALVSEALATEAHPAPHRGGRRAVAARPRRRRRDHRGPARARAATAGAPRRGGEAARAAGRAAGVDVRGRPRRGRHLRPAARPGRGGGQRRRARLPRGRAGRDGRGAVPRPRRHRARTGARRGELAPTAGRPRLPRAGARADPRREQPDGARPGPDGHRGPVHPRAVACARAQPSPRRRPTGRERRAAAAPRAGRAADRDHRRPRPRRGAGRPGRADRGRARRPGRHRRPARHHVPGERGDRAAGRGRPRRTRGRRAAAARGVAARRGPQGARAQRRRRRARGGRRPGGRRPGRTAQPAGTERASRSGRS